MNYGVLETLVFYLLVVLAYYDQVTGQAVDTYGPPKVEKNPLYLDSFIPASMQVIVHVTDLMKYEPTSPATSTVPPPTTSSHRPAIFAPLTPPSLHQRLTTTNVWAKLGELQAYPDIGGYFNRYRHGWSLIIDTPTPRPAFKGVQTDGTNKLEDLNLLGSLSSNLYKKVNTIEDFDEDLDVFSQVEKFTDDYDDKVAPFLRKKRPPPTRAYVTLLSLYDNLNKEAKRLALNKYAGYSRRVLEELKTYSRGTSAYQLERVLTKVVERRDITQDQIVKKMNTLIEDLQKPDSYINQALQDIPPLAFDVDF